MTPALRLAARAFAAGLTTFLVQLQQSATWDKSLIEAAIVAGVLAGLEYLTPLNTVVGPGKTATIVPDPKA